MKIARAQLKSVTPYSQSKFHQEPKINEGKELHADYEIRTWRSRMHTNEDGFVMIPNMQYKTSLAEAAKFNPRKIEGKRNQTWTKNFLAGIQVTQPVVLGIHIDNVPHEDVLCSSDGRKGGSSKVVKRFGVIQNWSGVVDYVIADETITQDIFTTYLRECGQFIGIGRFRPRNGGWYGQFVVEDIKWSDFDISNL